MVARFSQMDVEDLLVACHRRCCICHRFCGVKIEIDHIEERAKGGPSTIDNAIPVCFECHAEIHSYNDQHPRGKKFRPEELRNHRDQWLEICKNQPEIFNRGPFSVAGVGALQSLIDELEFNEAVGKYSAEATQGCLFHDEQFRAAIRQGTISTVRDELKRALVEAYVAIGRANQHITGVMAQQPRGNAWGEAVNRAGISIGSALPKIREAHNALLQFLSVED